MRSAPGARRPAPGTATVGSTRGCGDPPRAVGQSWVWGPLPPTRPPLETPSVLLPRECHCPGTPWGMGSPAPQLGPPAAGKVPGINNAHCFPLMNITEVAGRQLRAPAGGAGTSPASLRPGTPQLQPAEGPRIKGKSVEVAGAFSTAACHHPGCHGGPWAELAGSLEMFPTEIPTCPRLPSCPHTGAGERDRGVLGQKLPQCQGCLGQPSPTELQGEPGLCPQPLAVSPALGITPGAQGQCQRLSGPNPAQGPTVQGSTTGHCFPQSLIPSLGGSAHPEEA